MQVQNLALAREEVVFDVETIHRLEMAPQHGRRDQLSDGGRFTSRIFNGMKGLQSHLQVPLVDFVPLRPTRIQVPAVIIEAGLTGESFNLRARFFFQVRKPNHNIRHLHTCIVDVILNVDFPSSETKQPYERVAENGVSQMPNMRRFVRVDTRMLNQDLAGWHISGGLLISREGSGEPGA